MENASKALVMAGEILIALLVVGALMLMINQVSYYQKSESTSEKAQQQAEFNKEYVQFTYGDVKGYELISLVNKVINYNSKEAVGNSVDYSLKITVNIDMVGTTGTSFAQKYGINGNTALFKKIYTISDGNTNFYDDISKYRELENTYSLSIMSKLSANYDKLKAVEGKNDEYANAMKEITGRAGVNVGIKDIEKYREYSEFKTSTFKPGEVKYYPNGQVKEMSFEFKN